MQYQQFDSRPPNYPSNKHRSNTFSSRVSIGQAFSYLFVIIKVIIYYVFLFQMYQSNLLMVLFSIATLVMAVSSFVAELDDPTDRMVYYYKWSLYDKNVRFEMDYNIIYFCDFCDSYCSETSKHCQSCNRCVEMFDHHCIWFNNCVGRSNYKAFIFSIVSTLFQMVIFSIHGGIVSVGLSFDNGSVIAGAVFTWIAMLFDVILGFLLLNLILLHIYLTCKNITTYQFLQQRKVEEQQNRASNTESRSKTKSKSPVPLTIETKGHEERLVIAQPQSKLVRVKSKDAKIEGKENCEESQSSFKFKKVGVAKKEESLRNSQRESQEIISNVFTNTNNQPETQNEGRLSPSSEQISGVKPTERRNHEVNTVSCASPVRLEPPKLPAFLSQNRSLKMMLPPLEDYSSPTKRIHFREPQLQQDNDH